MTRDSLRLIWLCLVALFVLRVSRVMTWALGWAEGFDTMAGYKLDRLDVQISELSQSLGLDS